MTNVYYDDDDDDAIYSTTLNGVNGVRRGEGRYWCLQGKGKES